VTFIDKDGEEHTFEVAKGDNLLDIAQANDIEMEGKSWKALVIVPAC
jgi:ferredoxin-2, mitochondrial